LTAGSSDNEKELLARIAQGDEKAFAVIVNQYWPRIYSVSLTFIKSTHTAEDMVQDVFLKVWEKRESLKEIGSFNSWIFITARNTIISFLRKKGSAPMDELPVQLPSGDQEPEEAMRMKQLQELINKGLKLLPEQQRRIYTLSRQEGLSHDEICGELGLAKSSVKNALVKALNFLRQYLREQTDPFLFILFIPSLLLMYI